MGMMREGTGRFRDATSLRAWHHGPFYGAKESTVADSTLCRRTLADFAGTPFARAAYVHVDSDSFDEDGGAAELHGEGSSNSIGLSTLGVRLNQVLTATDTTSIRAYGELGWRHVYGDVTPETDLAFVSGGDDFTIKGMPLV